VAEEERARVIATARESLGAQQPLLAGVSAESTEAAARQARDAATAGADAVLVLTPHYYRDEMSVDALVAHYARVADRSPVPVLLYNVPKFTGLAVPADAVSRLARHGNVVGMKDSTGDLEAMLRVLELVDRPFALFCGAAALVSRALEAGASGAILAAAAVVPEPFVEVCAAWRRGDHVAVRAAAERGAAAAAWATSRGIAGLKAALDLRGLSGGAPRLPLLPLDAEHRGALSRELDVLVETGVLPARVLAS
jgi:4-hydroxy-2-oxoglutarate aldolase